MRLRQFTAAVLVALQLTAHAAADFNSWPSISNGQPGPEVKQFLLELHGNSTVLDTDLLKDPNVQALHSRHLLADAQLSDWAKYAQQGRYVVIKNPSMPGM